MLALPNLFAVSVTSGFVGFYGGKFVAGYLKHLLLEEDDDDYEFQNVKTKENEPIKQSAPVHGVESTIIKSQQTAVFYPMEQNHSLLDSLFSLQGFKEHFSRWIK